MVGIRVYGSGDDDYEDVLTYTTPLHQYDVATMSRVDVFQDSSDAFAISPCSRVVVVLQQAT